MPTFIHDGIAFHYVSVGHGEPIIICHGLTGDLTAPQELLGNIAGHHLVFVDARAHGQTHPVGPASKLCFRQFASDLHALMGHLGIKQAILGGISMGAGVAIRCAIDFPEYVRALVLIRPAWLNSSLPDNLKLFPLIARLFDQYGSVKWQDAFGQLPEVNSLRKKDSQLVDTLQRHFDAPYAIERSARLIHMPEDAPIQNWQAVESLDVPALVIGNKNDPIHPYSYAESWAEHLRFGQLKSVPTKSTHHTEYIRGVRAHLYDFLSALADRQSRAHRPA